MRLEDLNDDTAATIRARYITGQMDTTIKHAHEGYSCWTPKLCAALNAVAELRTAAIRHDDHELSVRLDLIEETLKRAAPASSGDWVTDLFAKPSAEGSTP